MDDTEDDARYPPQRYSVNHHSAYDSSIRSRHPNRNPSYPVNNNNYRDEDDNIEYEDDGADEEDDEENHESDDQDEDDEEEEDDGRIGHQKKRRLDNLVSNYEFAPRVAPKPSSTARNSPAEWTEHATFVLLEAWGDRFLELGRKSLRSEDWFEVAEKVSEASKVERTEAQCRNRLDTLKKKYRKEKAKMEEMGGNASKWAFFKKMDMLLNSPRQQCGLACGVDSGEYVFMNPRVYLNRSNGLDEMRDSPGESESSGDDDSDGLPPKRKGFGGEENNGSSFRLLADSIQKFGEIYEKIENSKRQQMMELEKMRMDFQRDLEVQKKQILERAQAEIAKIQQEDDQETDSSTENLSG
ncbi:trihelix transcription factor ENAP1 [Cornus florida]|uniref:trihelix transcription factor ENAP1 n=1 Tax=Cornus florida TaxID=4283 RepID=UPI002896F1D1|nr:trihelix transcription factor ENAP1 [Cornus florida]XP_059634977.1 trihelix transcription factor ENAP1 [Cornus florida]